MLDFVKNTATIQFFGITGSFVALLGSIIAGIPYRGKDGRPYSPLNHFISELGEVGVSRLAWIFNVSLILTGTLLLPCCIGIGLRIPGIWSKLGMVFGCLTAIALSLVGVFPMNKLDPHSRSATAYFRLGLVMILLFTIAIATQNNNPPAIPRLVGLAGVPAVCAYAFFLIYSNLAFRSTGNALGTILENRPRFWLLTIAEWAIFLTTIPWFCAISLGLYTY